MKKDYYQILGINKSASKDEIRRAYRKLAHESHPDKQGGKADRFREVNEAYEVLSDDAKRAQYDRFGSAFAQGYGGQAGFGGFSDFDFGGFDFSGFSAPGGSAWGGDFGDIFSDIFGGGRKAPRKPGVDLEMRLAIDFLEGVFGAKKEIVLEKRDACPKCRGSGAAEGSKVIQCPKCHGQGQIITHKQTILGSFQRAEQCGRCGGSGQVPEKECPECRGAGVKKQSRKIEIAIPAGIDSGQRLRIAGEGEMGYLGSAPGDLYIEIHIRTHTEFKRQGANIFSEIPVSFYQAALGGEAEVKTVDGPVMLKIPAGTQSGKVLRLSGRGVPRGSSRGDHFVTVRVLTPQKLTKKEKELLRALSEERGETTQINKSFWDKIKDSF